MIAIRDKLIDYYETFAAEHIKRGNAVTPNNLMSYASYATKIVATDKDGKNYYDQFKGDKVERFINDLWNMGTFKKYYPKQI